MLVGEDRTQFASRNRPLLPKFFRILPVRAVGLPVEWRSWLCTLLAPTQCIFCGAVVTCFADGSVCRGCWHRMDPVRVSCLRCGQEYAGGRCASCAQCAPLVWIDVARCYGRYRGELGQVLRQYKYRRDRSLAPGVARLMGRAFEDCWKAADWDMMVPVATHPSRIRQREFDHMELVGRLLEKRLGLPFQQALIKRLASKPQAGLPEKQRRRNVRRTFAVRRSQSGRILLLDDVFTTGATVNECARVLKRAGAVSVGVLTAARAE